MWKATTPLNEANNTQYFWPADWNWEMKMMPFTASQALEDGGAVGIEISGSTTTGYLDVMWTENAAGADFVGILAEPIASWDDDYATAGKLKGVWVPTSIYAKAYFTPKAGTFTAVDVFKTVEITSGSLGLSVDTAGDWPRITAYISATRGICEFSMPATQTA